jgi:hypothetical protein
MPSPLIVEGVIALIQVVSSLARASGMTKEQIKAQVDKDYEMLEQKNPDYLPDPPAPLPADPT